MPDKSKAHRGKVGGNQDNGGNNLHPQYTPTAAKIQDVMLACRLGELMHRADRLMITDPENYPTHWQIWASLHAWRSGYTYTPPGGDV